MQKIEITESMLRTMLNGVHSPGSGIRHLGAFPDEAVEDMRTALDSLLNGDEGLREQMMESGGWAPADEYTVLHFGDEVERHDRATGITRYGVVGSVTSAGMVVTQEGGEMGYLDDLEWRYRRLNAVAHLPAQDMAQIIPRDLGSFIRDKSGREYTILTLNAEEQVWYDAHHKVLAEDIVPGTWIIRA